jgi:putative photosynthetic complex assembly protein
MSASTHSHEIRGPLWIIAAVMVFALAATALARLTGHGPPVSHAQALAQRALVFTDLPDGSIGVTDAASGAVLEPLQGEQGFVRGVLRALARERRLTDPSSRVAFELSATADGRLVLNDPVTNQQIDLQAFGATNAAVFARLLNAAPPPVAGPSPQAAHRSGVQALAAEAGGSLPTRSR